MIVCLKMFFFRLECTCEETCESVWPPNSSLYASSTCVHLRLLAGPFGQSLTLRVCFFKKIQDWIFKSWGIRELILRFFTRQIIPRSFGSWCVKGTEESSLEVDFSVPLTHHDPRDPGLIYLVKKHKIHFQILSDLKIQSWIFLKKRTLNHWIAIYPVDYW